MRWQESAKSRSHQMREGESIGRWYRAIPPHRMWIGWDALQFGGQRLATDAEPRARLRRLDPAVAQLDWPAFGAQRCYFSDDAIFSRPALAQPSSTKPLGAPPTPMLPITSSPDLITRRREATGFPVRWSARQRQGWRRVALPVRPAVGDRGRRRRRGFAQKAFTSQFCSRC